MAAHFTPLCYGEDGGWPLDTGVLWGRGGGGGAGEDDPCNHLLAIIHCCAKKGYPQTAVGVRALNGVFSAVWVMGVRDHT